MYEKNWLNEHGDLRVPEYPDSRNFFTVIWYPQSEHYFVEESSYARHEAIVNIHQRVKDGLYRICCGGDL